MRDRLRPPSPALAVAVVALFVALGGTTYAATSLARNSVGTQQLKKNAVTAPKLRNGAVTEQKISDSAIAAIEAGGGSILTFDANATPNPSPTTLGTALGDTWAAECALSGDHAELSIFLKTRDGSWSWDLGQEISGTNGSSSAGAFEAIYPAGTYSTLTKLGEDPGGTNAGASTFDLEDHGVQLAPAPGYLALHATVIDTMAPTHTCHMSVNAMPETVVATSALPRRAATRIPPAELFGKR